MSVAAFPDIRRSPDTNPAPHPARAPPHRPGLVKIKGDSSCAVLSCTPPATSASRTATSRPSSNRPTPSSALSATCVCGSDLWPYRGIEKVDEPPPMGHEYVGIVEEVGSDVSNVKPGQFVIGSFFASDNTCEICRAGYQTSCVQRQPGAATGAQAEYLRVPLADGTLVATPELPSDDLVPSLLAASDVLGTGWFGAVAAEAGPARPSRSSATARSACSACSPPSSSAPSGSSP